MIYPPVIDYAMPAFYYDYNQDKRDEGVRIYFALSNYNSTTDKYGIHLTVRYQKNNANALNSTKYPHKMKFYSSFNEVTPDIDPVIASKAARYYIILKPDDLSEGAFNPDLIYKVQIRFSTITEYDNTTNYTANQLANSASEWSTVCLLKPIRKITFGVAELDDGEDENLEEDASYTTILATLLSDFMGYYIPDQSSETLKHWRMRLYDWSKVITDQTSEEEDLLEDNKQVLNLLDYKEYLLADTDWQTSLTYDTESGRVAFNANLKYIMTNNNSYRLVYQIETRNGYTDMKSYYFTAMSYATGTINGILTLTINEEDGYAKINLNPPTGQGSVVHANVTLRRTSSKSNFTIWEDIANTTIENDYLIWLYYDFTILSGVFYQYGAQTRDNRGRRSSMIKTTQLIGEWLSSFLLEKGESLEDAIQLKIKYDMNISNMIVNIGLAKIDTIGSKYPFVRRNGDMYYHTFPFSFLITGYTDNTHIFVKEKLLRNSSIEELYDIVYNQKELQYPSIYKGAYDYSYEKEFRQKVLDFLYNNKVKLFRSLTEGNYLIKLMGITLTPKMELGRLLYSVDATAVEIDEATIERFDYYGIQKIGTFNPNITFNEAKIGQLNRISLLWDKNGDLTTEELIYPAGTNIIGDKVNTNESTVKPITIVDKYKYGQVVNGVMIDNFYLSYLRILVDSPPYLIKINDDGSLSPVDDSTTLYVSDNGFLKSVGDFTDYLNIENLFDESDKIQEAIDAATEAIGQVNAEVVKREILPTDPDKLLLGTIININGEDILIEYPNTIYEMKDPNVRIDPTWVIYPKKDTKLLIDFAISLSEINDTSNIASKLKYRPINGQLVDTFESRDSLYNLIWRKYYFDSKPDNRFLKDSNIKPYYLRVNTIYTMNVEALPGVVFYARSNSQEFMLRFVIDETGELFIDPGAENGYIADAYFYGVNLEKRLLNKKDSKPDKPFDLDAYKENEEYYIFYQGRWIKAIPQDIDGIFRKKITDSSDLSWLQDSDEERFSSWPASFDIACPVDGYVSYYIQTEKGIY